MPESSFPTLEALLGVAPKEPERDSYWDLLRAGGKRFSNTIQREIPQALDAAHRPLTPEENRYYDAWAEHTDREARKIAPVGPASFGDITSGKVGVIEGTGELIASALPYMTAQAAGGALGFLAGGPAGAAVGATAFGAPVFAGTNVARAREETGGVTQEQAQRSWGFGVAQAGLDSVAGVFLPGVGKFLGTGLAKAIGPSAGAGLVRRTVSQGSKAALTEGVTEASQQLMERAAVGIPLSGPDAMAEYVESFGAGALMGGAFGGVGGAVSRRPQEPVDKVDQSTDTAGIADVVDRALGLTSPIPRQRGFAAKDPAKTAFADPSFTPEAEGLQVARGRSPETPADRMGMGAELDPAFTGTNMGTSALDRALGTGGPVAEGGYGRDPFAPATEAPAAAQNARVAPDSSTMQLFANDPQKYNDTRLAEIAENTGYPPQQRAAAEQVFADREEARGNFETLTEGLDKDKAAQIFFKATEQAKADGVDINADFYRLVVQDKLQKSKPSKIVRELADRLGIARIEAATEAAPTLQAVPDAEPEAAKPAKSPLRGNQDLLKIAKLPEAEQAGAVRTLLENGDTRKRTLDAATALGIDVNEMGAAPSTLENVAALQTEGQAAAPVRKVANISRDVDQLANPEGTASPDFDDRLFDLAGRDPTSAERAKELEQLTKKQVTGKGRVTTQVPSHQMEDLMVARGFYAVDPKDPNVLEPTEKFRQFAAARDKNLAADAAVAARDAGLSPDLEGAFVRGAQGQEANLTSPAPEFEAAHAAGLQWREARYRIASHDDSQEVLGRNVGFESGPSQDRTEIARRQGWQGTIDARLATRGQPRKESAAPQAYPDNITRDDVKAIRGMVREGASDEELRAADAVLLEGNHLDVVEKTSEEIAAEAANFEGAKPDVSLADRTRRNVEAEERRVAAEKYLNSRQYKEKVRLLKDELKARYDGGEMSGIQLAMLLYTLNHGNVSYIQKVLSEPVKLGMSRSVEPYSPADEVAMELALQGATIKEVSQYLQDNARTKFDEMLVDQIAKNIAVLERNGISFEFAIAHEGMTNLPAELAEARGMIEARGKLTRVWINGSDVVGGSGMHYEVLLHEMLHAATVTAVQAGKTVRFRGTQLQKSVKALVEVLGFIQAHTQNLASSGQNLTEFQQELVDKSHNALDNEHELLVWTLSSPRMQAYLNEVQYAPSQTMLSKFVAAVREFLDLTVKDDSALAEVLRLSEDIITTPAMRALDATYNVGDLAMLARGGTVGTAQAAQDAMAAAVPRVLDAASKALPLKNVGRKLRNKSWAIMSTDHLARIFGDRLDGLVDMEHLDRTRHAIHNIFSGLFSAPHQAFNALPEKPKKWVNRLMQMTEHGVNPELLWKDQPWLHDLPNAAELKKVVGEANQLVNNLKRSDAKGGYDVYKSLSHLNESSLYAELATKLTAQVERDTQLSLELAEVFGEDPMTEFRNNHELSINATAARGYWRGVLTERLGEVESYIKHMKGTLNGLSQADKNKTTARISPLEAHALAIKTTLARAEQAPYFHLGRAGDQFLSFTIRNKDKIVDKAALVKVATAMEAAGLDGVMVSTESAQPSAYVRFENKDQRLQAEAVLKTLKAEGLLDEETAIKSGPTASSGYAITSGRADWISDTINRLEASSLFDTDGLDEAEAAQVRETKKLYIDQFRTEMLNTMADTSLVKVMAQRTAKHGYTKDMVQNSAMRQRITAVSLANLSTAPKITKAFEAMRAAYNRATDVTDEHHKSVDDMFGVMNEMLIRHYQRGEIEETATSDQLRALSNAWFLGMSPAYVFTQLTQIPVLLMPELGSRYGYRKTFNAVAKATPIAFKIMGAVIAEGKSGGFRGLSDMAITPTVLEKAGLSPAQLKFISNMVGSGLITIGSSAREISRVAEGTGHRLGEDFTRFASAPGLYAETLTRLIAAFATQELHGGKPDLIGSARYVINEAMLTYTSSNTARAMGKQGIAGAATPFATQFMQYTAQLTQKLYRELIKSVQGDRAAQKFMLGHLTAVTALAGTMGAPFATFFAWAIEKLVDLFDDDDEPYDATEAYRSFIHSIFGDGMGDVVSRGVPRALGFDVSARLGEQDLLPFSGFLADRRGMKESIVAVQERSYGAAFSMIGGWMKAAEHTSDGKYMDALIEFSPLAIKNVAKGYKMTDTGYTDSQGRKLPIETPGTAAILYQLVGLQPADKAEDGERRTDHFEREVSLRREASVLRNALVKAYSSGDKSEFVKLQQRARKFDRDNPDYSVMPDIARSVQRRTKEEHRAATHNLPLGVRPTRDNLNAVGY